ncbi:HlyD family secretion protein [Pseudoalteromonas sp. T1lg75]|uniref:HlyD family secretion protein n=1 Tax=Pseudoalteromonas sp. T1lg75 TaxID=2077102 RepID=UPI000CF722D7|nr:HlyD family efflux transporter periplasmic adaptor subunit [Pseudoalteromonas sp. T1lg75]
MEQHLEEKQNRPTTYLFLIAVALGLIVLVVKLTWFATSKVPGEFSLIHQVKQGIKSETINGLGAITVRETSLIDAQDPGRITQLSVRLGQAVERGQALAKIQNHELEQEYKLEKAQLITLKSDVAMRKSELLTEKYRLESQLAKAIAAKQNQALELEAYEILVKQGVVSQIRYKQAKIQLQQQRIEVSLLEQQQEEFSRTYQVHEAALDAKYEAKQEQIRYLESRLDALTITAQSDGIISDISIELGQQVLQGDPLFKIIEPQHFIAQVAIAQYSSEQLSTGLPATIKTPNGELAGKIEHIDTVVRQGSVNIYIAFDQTPPSWLRSKQSIEASIALSKRTNYMFIDQPNNFTTYKRWQVYKLNPGANTADKLEADFKLSNQQLILTSNAFEAGDKLLLIPQAVVTDERLTL